MNGSFDISSFIPKFVSENKDRIQKLNRDILSLEKNASDNELLKEVMREIHTLKGTARLMGFGDIVSLSHKVEDIFAKIKEGNIQSTQELYDIVFQALDMLSNMVDVKLKNPHVAINADDICRKLESFCCVVDEISTNHTRTKKVENLPESHSDNGKIQNLPHSGDGESKETPDESKVVQENRKALKIGLDKINALYNHLVELTMVQIASHQRYEDATKLMHYARQFKAIKTAMDSNIGSGVSDNGKLHEIIARYADTEKCFTEEISAFLKAHENDIVKLDTIIEGIRQLIMSIRMQPISTIFDLADRLVRDLSRQTSKEVNLVVSGSNVELDNNIIEMLKDPLVHLLRNAIDHGIEEPATRTALGKEKTGTITLSAKQEGANILITVEDDGKGVDKELVKEIAIQKRLLDIEKAKVLSDEEIFGFIIKPGFTTSKIITDTSGRGVGMDVVKTTVDRLNGSLIIESNKNQGSRFILKVPSTVALISVLIVRVENMTFAIPTNTIEYITRIFWKDITTLRGKASVPIKGQTIPLVCIADIFMLETKEERKGKSLPIILSGSNGKKVGFIISEFLQEKEVVFREFTGYLKRSRYFSGVTTLGTGEVVLILNMPELIKSNYSEYTFSSSAVSQLAKTFAKKNLILIAEDSLITAELEKNILINAGYEVDIANDGTDAMGKLYRKNYDLLITDIDMPRMDGFKLTAKVKTDERLKDIPVIIVTAKEKDDDKRKGIEVGADAYILKKEFDQSNLLNTITRLLGE